MAYIGQSLTEGTRRAYTFVATAGQTTFNAVYGVGAVDVYQNGILLQPSDYNSSSGSSVVLGVGAAVNDEITIIAHNTFSVADTVSSSQGGTFTGNVSMSGTLGVTGAVTAANGLTVDDDGATPLTVDRATSFGNVVDIQKDGSTVGGISTFYGNPMFGRNSGARLAFDTNVIYSSNDAGSTADNAYALGSASSRFTDIYLSGGAYLGGTGAANKLDDYEEGTWTPSFSFSGGSVGYSYQAGQYTKIGRKVFVTANMILNSASNPTGAVHVVTLPFTSGDDSNGVIAEGYVAGVTYSLVRNLTTQSPNIRGYVPRNSTYMLLTNNHTGQGHVAFDASLLGSSTLIYLSATYFAAA